jgi:sec-independent protein translocase protein TatC
MTEEKVMTFTEHLEELRTRLKWAVISLTVGFAIAYYFAEVIFVILAKPMIEAWRSGGLGTPKLHFSNPIEPFFTYMKVGLIGGVFLAAPAIFYQLWQFVAPGLKKNEKKYAIPFATFSAFFFVGGALFGYFVVFPIAFQFFLGFAQNNMGEMHKLFGGTIAISLKETFQLTPTLMMGEYFSLVWRLLIGFGVVFETPLVIFFLAISGVVSVGALWRFNRYFIVLAFIIGAILTPPDVLTQVLMAVPLIVLYNLSILFAYFLRKRKPV